MTKNDANRLGYARAIIEVSSNTIHLIAIPDSPNGIIIDKKHQCGLGDYPKGTIELNPKGIEKALKTIGKYMDIIDDINPQSLVVIGTGALRDASNAWRFIETLKQQHGIDLHVITGEEESHYSAIGVQSAFNCADGIVWDMGGRTSEFAIIKGGAITDCISLPLGTFSIKEQETPDLYIHDILKELPQNYRDLAFENLYVVGGSPRQILKSHKDYFTGTKKDIEGYQVDKDQAEQLSVSLMNANNKKLRRKFNISKKRTKHIASSSLLLIHLMEILEVENITASEHGLRHGVFEEMKEEKDPPDLDTDSKPEETLEIDS